MAREHELPKGGRAGRQPEGVRSPGFHIFCYQLARNRGQGEAAEKSGSPLGIVGWLAR